MWSTSAFSFFLLRWDKESVDHKFVFLFAPGKIQPAAGSICGHSAFICTTSNADSAFSSSIEILPLRFNRLSDRALHAECGVLPSRDGSRSLETVEDRWEKWRVINAIKRRAARFSPLCRFPVSRRVYVATRKRFVRDFVGDSARDPRIDGVIYASGRVAKTRALEPKNPRGLLRIYEQPLGGSIAIYRGCLLSRYICALLPHAEIQKAGVVPPYIRGRA